MAAVLVGLSIIRGQRNNPIKIGYGLVQIPFLEIGHGPAVECIWIAGIYLNGPVEIDNGLVQIAF